LAIGDSRISLPAPPPGPVGTQVLVEVLDVRQATGPGTTTAGEGYGNFLRLGTDWPALKQTVEALVAASAGSATAVAAADLPHLRGTGPESLCRQGPEQG
jgi:hypothetical protein